MAALDPNAYAHFRTGYTISLEGGQVWWHDIVPRDRQRIIDAIFEHAQALQRLGYAVEVQVPADRSNADLYVKFPTEWGIGTADIEILKGALAATQIVAGWGGPGAFLLFFVLPALQGLGIA